MTPFKRYPTNDRMLRYSRLPHTVFSDTMFASSKSLRQNTCAQIFCTSFGWARAFPMKSKGLAHEALSLLFKRDGVPPDIVLDGSKEQVLGEFKRKLNEANCHLKMTEPYSPWSQAAEGCIREIKRGAIRKLLKTRCPKVLWDHCIELEALIRAHSTNGIFSTAGEVPETIMKGQTADISTICEFGWFDWVMFLEPDTVKFPHDKWTLGRYLGPAIDVGSAMTAKILKDNGQFVCRSTLRHLTPDEVQNPEYEALKLQFTQELDRRLGKACTEKDFAAEDLTPDLPLFDHDTNPSLDDDLEPTPEAGDNYLTARVMIPRGSSLARESVIGRKRDANDNLVGHANANPILDTRTYLVRFDDGEVTELTANTIAQCIYAQCDLDGNEYLLLDSFVDYRKSGKALSLADQKIVTNGKPSLRRSTAGWQICCQWKDGSTSWQRLSDLKESHPVQVAEFATAQKIDHEPAFNWWVPHTLKKRQRIIALVRERQAKYLKKSQKFGIEVPSSVAHALELDKTNGNTLWADAIAKEMKNVRIAFKILTNGEIVPNGHTFIKCHMIFDVKMEDFRRKARMVAGGHMTDVPAEVTYASVVSRETIRVALTLAALNGLEVKTGDILNAYITAPTKEKVWCILGPEFGADSGKKALIVRALYGLKSAGAAFRAHLADCMRQLEYTPCLADPDLWLKRTYNPMTKSSYYSYVLIYVDDILVIHHDALTILKRLGKYFTLKPESVGDPDMYLGAKLREAELGNKVFAWSLSPSKYIKEAVRNCETHLSSHFGGRYSFPKRAENPFRMDYDPDMDTTPLLTPDAASYYQSIIGVMRWVIELGRIDIATEISLLSSYLAMPREGHLDAAINVMAYLKLHHNSRLVLDPTYPTIVRSDFKVCDWREFYGDIKEAIPPNAPEPLGKDVDLRMFVDSDHAGDKTTRRSRTGFLIYLNMACVNWISKKQPTIESSVFGAEFVALKNGMEALRGLRYKLRMMGVPISGPSYIYGDNMSVVYNTQKPESTLKKKSNSICYHAVRESVAMGESLVAHIPTASNLADLLTKVTFGAKRRRLVKGILYDLYDDK